MNGDLLTMEKYHFVLQMILTSVSFPENKDLYFPEKIPMLESSVARSDTSPSSTSRRSLSLFPPASTASTVRTLTSSDSTRSTPASGTIEYRHLPTNSNENNPLPIEIDIEEEPPQTSSWLCWRKR